MENIFKVPEFSELSKAVYQSGRIDIKSILNKERLALEDLALLLSPSADEYLPLLAKRSSEITVDRFGRTVQIYAPLYLSSYCGNRCLYCGFSAENRIDRRVLSMDEAVEEAGVLAERGIDHLLLVSGEAPGKLDADYLEAITVKLRERFASISIEVQPLSEHEYARLFRAGVTSVAVYQETYDSNIYEKVHLSGPKADPVYRLETPARVAAAGMREVGIGALLGLSDWRLEGLALGMHLAWLRKKFWRTGLTVSFPRLRPAAGDFDPIVNVKERDLAHLLFALRLFDPDVGLILSTREEERFRDGMIGLGPTRYSAGSCTAPGGYSEPGQDGEQFSVGDLRTIEDVCLAIRSKGYDPVLKDWDPVFQQFQSGEKAAA